MPDPEKISESADRPKEDASKPDVLSPKELQSVHEDANKNAASRATFLKDSLGKGMSPSTEYLKDMVVNIVDGAKPIVGLAGNDLSIMHPIDSIKEIARRISGDPKGEGDGKPADPSLDGKPSDKPGDKPADSNKPTEKPAEASKPAEKPEEVLDKYKKDPDTKEQREKLEKLAEKNIKDPAELKKFKEDMDAFEKRGSEMNPPLKPEDIKGTYREISKLMEKPDGADVPIKLNDRVKLAEQVMRQSAHPTDISQGEYGTCNTTTVEVRTYTKNPAEAARLVSDVATTGKYTSNGNPPVTVELDKDSLARHGQSKNDVVEDNKRTYASQVFEVTATNIHYKNSHDHGAEDIRYEQHEPRPAGPHNKPPADNGERLYNYSKLDPKTGKPTEVSDPHNDKIPARNPNLGNDAIVEINKQINPEPKDGRQDGPVLLSRESNDPKQAEKVVDLKNQLYGIDLKQAGIGDGTPPDLKDPESIKKTKEAIDQKEKDGLDPAKAQKLRDDLDTLVKEKNQEYRNDKGVVYVHSPAEMEKTLAKMKEEGRLPAIIAVSSSAEPFKSDGGGHAAGDLGGGHVVTVTDYHPAADGKPATVDVDNQWGKSADKTMTVEQLYNAQEPPKGPVMEKLESLEKKYAAHEIKDADYDKELQKLYVEQIKRSESARNTGDSDKEILAVETFKDSLRQLQPAPSRGQKIMQAAIADYKKEKAAAH